MAERGSSRRGSKGGATGSKGGSTGSKGGPSDADLRRLRAKIDAVDRKIVGLLHERAGLVLDVGRTKSAMGRRAIRDLDREREVLLRVAMANDGPLPQADLLAIYRALMAASRRLEAADRKAAVRKASVRQAAEPGASDPPGSPRNPGDRVPR